MRSPVPGLVRSLKALDGILRKGEDFCLANSLDTRELLDARVAPTMKPLTHQIRLACDHAATAVARLSGRDAVTVDGAYETFGDLYASIAAAQVIIESLPTEDVGAFEQCTLRLALDDRTVVCTGYDYLMQYAIPNFYFSVTTAYIILRGKGVPLGKNDFLGPWA
ncbi:DUF1993 domain-containing protein [Alsobacter sp. SYSU M60028]|uniref:DUF1993 domain-containing protein n=1 Tax=Alsobacter ponti TaxID=2962936 RepID=A0ABT1L7I3_9HYPH|nr:DUF1993 domain-containing protein [Alsobacter ponti]MCP8937420.1 DUF1993 domain-containing protein [Alsobacter ponti]